MHICFHALPRAGIPSTRLPRRPKVGPSESPGCEESRATGARKSSRGGILAPNMHTTDSYTRPQSAILPPLCASTYQYCIDTRPSLPRGLPVLSLLPSRLPLYYLHLEIPAGLVERSRWCHDSRVCLTPIVASPALTPLEEAEEWLSRLFLSPTAARLDETNHALHCAIPPW